jgi:hypothetical protein
MKKRLALLGVAAGLAYSAGASAAPCSTSPVSYSSWVNNASFSCQVGDLTFSNFSYSPTATGGATPVPATSVNVFALPSANNNGLEFTSGGWVSSANPKFLLS